jgi:LysM repeat protein
MEDVPPRRRGHERVDAGRDAPPDDPRNDAYAPAWERPRRLEAYPTLRSRRLSSAILPSLLLAVIVVLIAGAALFFVPSFLGLGSGPGAGASPSSSLPGASLPAASVVPTVAPAATPTTYVVQAGDTMSRIAKKFGVSLSDLIAANADTLPNPDKLQIGDTLIIPTPAPSELPGASQP